MCLATHAGALDRCNGYVAGCNTTFFGKGKDGAYSVDNVRDQINERLTLANGEDVDYPSMLSFPEEFNAATARDQVISISNRVLPWDTTNGDSRKQFPGGETGWLQAGGKGLEGIHYGAPRCSERPLPAKPTSVFHPASAARVQARTSAPRPTRVRPVLSNAAASRGNSPLPPHTQTHNPTPRASDFIAASTVNNSICFLGPHRVYSQWSATYQELVPGQGHFGPDALPGVRTQLACKFCNSLSLLTLHLALTGCPLAPRRVGVARVGAQRDDRHRGGGALAARLPEAQLERRRRRSRPRTRRAKRARRERDKREARERHERGLLRLTETY